MDDSLALIIIGLAAWRLARVWARDELFSGTQDALDRWAFDHDGNALPVINEDGYVRRFPTFLRDKTATLLTCVYCVSWWLAVGMLWAWFDEAPWDWSPRDWIVSLAVAAPAAIISIYEDKK